MASHTEDYVAFLLETSQEFATGGAGRLSKALKDARAGKYGTKRFVEDSVRAWEMWLRLFPFSSHRSGTGAPVVLIDMPANAGSSTYPKVPVPKPKTTKISRLVQLDGNHTIRKKKVTLKKRKKSVDIVLTGLNAGNGVPSGLYLGFLYEDQLVRAQVFVRRGG